MADELDPTLESRLRDALHAEADGIGLTVRGAELRRAAAERRRARRSQRLGLLAAAASIVVVLGGGVLVAIARPDGRVAASPSAGTSRRLAAAATLLSIVGPDATPLLEGEHAGAADAATPVSVPLGRLGAGEGRVFVLDCAGGSVDVVFAGVDFASDSHTAHQACSSGPGEVTRADVAGVADVAVVADGATSWRIVFAQAPGPSAAVEPSATPIALASYADLEAILDAHSPGEPVLLRAEQAAADGVGASVPVDIGAVGAYDFVDIAVACTDGVVEVSVTAGSETVSRTEHRCGGEPFLLSDGVSHDGPARVEVQAMNAFTWRAVVAAWPRGASGGPTHASFPAPAERQPGATTLLGVPVDALTGNVSRVAEIPAGTDMFYVTAPCRGEGDISLVIDGVAATYPCGGIGLEVFTPGWDDLLDVTATATGGARFRLRVDALELADLGARWLPPRLLVSGPDATAGDIATLTAFPGCGWSWQPKDGGGFVDDCGPSWQPMAAALAQRPGTSVVLQLSDGWMITDVQAELARNGDILPSGRAPRSQGWTVDATTDEGVVVDVPAAGDWGVVLLVGGEKGGDRFQVPYYARIIVEGP